MEKEHSEGFSSLLLLLLFLIAIISCLELGISNDTSSAKAAGQEEPVHVPGLADTAKPVAAKALTE